MIRRTAICIAACVLTFGNALHADPYREVFAVLRSKRTKDARMPKMTF